MVRISLGGVFLLLFLASAASCWPPGSYLLHDLGPHGAHGMDADGNIVGTSRGVRQEAALLTKQGPQKLGLLPGGYFSHALGSQRKAEIVGYASTGYLGLHTHAFRWTPRLGMRSLGTLGSDAVLSAATATNSTATIAGYAEAQEGESILPVAWIHGVIEALPTLGGLAGFADAMNADGVIVGESQTLAGAWHATKWGIDGIMTDLHPADRSGSSRARDINHYGWVVGVSVADGVQEGWLWTPLSGIRSLPPLGGHSGSEALAINSAGLVVGVSVPEAATFPPPPSVAVLWRDGVPARLDGLLAHAASGWVIERAIGVSRRGDIAITGTYQGKRHSAVLEKQR